jgi:hypothetical protein
MVGKCLEPFPCLTARFYGYYDSYCGTLYTVVYAHVHGKVCPFLSNEIIWAPPEAKVPYRLFNRGVLCTR